MVKDDGTREERHMVGSCAVRVCCFEQEDWEKRKPE